MKQGNCISLHRAGMGGLLAVILSISSTVMGATIHDAARSGDLSQIQRLTIDGADVNEKAARDQTPLIIAALAGQGEVVNYLLQRGANIDARNDSGLSALHAAAFTGHADIVELLIAKGASMDDAKNKFQVTALHMASEENHLEVVQVLVIRGANLVAIEVNGFNALSRAGFREHWDVVNLLLAAGAACQPADTVGDWLYQECTSRATAN